MAGTATVWLRRDGGILDYTTIHDASLGVIFVLTDNPGPGLHTYDIAVSASSVFDVTIGVRSLVTLLAKK